MTTTTIATAADLATRAASDASFRSQLSSDPAAALQSAGIDVPAGATVQVLENTANLVNLILVSKPDDAAGATSASSNSWLDLWSQLVADTWTDPSLKSRLLEDPMTVLSERGLTLPSGVQARVTEASDTNLVVVVPA